MGVEYRSLRFGRMRQQEGTELSFRFRKNLWM